MYTGCDQICKKRSYTHTTAQQRFDDHFIATYIDKQTPFVCVSLCVLVYGGLVCNSQGYFL